MPNFPTLSLTASASNLRRLAIIRLIFITVLLTALAYAYLATNADLVHPVHLAMLAIITLLTLMTFWRLQQPWPVTDLEYFFQLLTDIAGLTALLYFSGGATNPFVSYYLVPLTISAAILPWRFTWVIAGLSLLAYSLMLFFYQPLPDFQPSSGHQHSSSGFNLHILGMWFTFALSTGLITYFVVKMANALRQQENLRVVSRENKLLDEQVLAVATLAAGTAHELGTPLATMTVLLDEMEQEYPQQPLGDDLKMLKAQVDSCRQILQGLVSTAEAHSHGIKETVVIATYMQQLLDHWQVIRPDATCNVDIDESCQSNNLDVDPTLEQTIINLLNNAADACANNIEITTHCQHHTLVITIRDRGTGIPLEMTEQLGKPFVTTKGKGLGLGLFLTHATINRYSGTIELHNHPDGGTVAKISLPLNTTTNSKHYG
jgi:two-component system sensor histidine kinase RegB